MARKQEFRPDRTGTHWFSKLHITQQQRKAILKWTLYSLALLVMALLQDVVFSRLRLWGSTSDLVPCAIFLILLIEGAQSACVFTVAAASFYVFSGTAPGTYSIAFITLIGICVSIFRQAYLRRGFVSAMVCVVVCMAVYELAVFGIGLFLELTYPARFPIFALTAGLSLIAAPILYPLFRLISAIGGSSWKD